MMFFLAIFTILKKLKKHSKLVKVFPMGSLIHAYFKVLLVFFGPHIPQIKFKNGFLNSQEQQKSWKTEGSLLILVAALGYQRS